MTLKLPAAPASFHAPSLSTLKENLEVANGASVGRIALITEVPLDIEKAWNDVGVSYDTDKGYNRGQRVVGHTSIGTISDILVGPVEPNSGETGYKLQFGEVLNVPIYIDGTGTSTTTIIGAALLKGVDTFAYGQNSDVVYIIAKTPLLVTDGTSINLDGFEIIIGYSEEVL